MRILAMTNLYPTPFHPTRAPFVRHQLRLLSQRHAVEVICPVAWTDEFKGRWKQRAWDFRRTQTLDGLNVYYPRYYFTPGFARGWYGSWFRSSVRRCFEQRIQQFRPELIFTPWAYPDGWAAVQLGHRYRLPVIVQVHGSDVLLLEQNPTRKRGTIEALQQADGIVAVSQDIKNRMMAHGVAEQKIRVIIDGVDQSLFFAGDSNQAKEQIHYARSEPLLLFVGNLLPVKAIDVLLQALKFLADQSVRFHLIVIGLGPLRKSLETLRDQLGLSNQVEFRGALPQTELPTWYRAADLFILPSHSEGVPNVLLEASASGTPWVASRVGGIPEIAELGDSRLVPPNQPVELASAIREHLTAPRKIPSGGKAREKAVAELEAWMQSVSGRSKAGGAAQSV